MSIIKTNQIQTTGGKLILGSTGSILQIVQGIKQDRQVVSSTSFVDITGLSATITPSSSSNKILILLEIRGSSVQTDMEFKIDRNGTRLSGMEGTVSGSATSSVIGHFYAAGSGGNTNAGKSHTMFYVDSPASTSALTYKVQSRGSQGFTHYINTNYDNANLYYEMRLASAIILMEVSG